MCVCVYTYIYTHIIYTYTHIYTHFIYIYDIIYIYKDIKGYFGTKVDHSALQCVCFNSLNQYHEQLSINYYFKCT